MFKRKLLSTFIGFSTVLFLSVGVVPEVNAQKIKDVSKNSAPAGSLAQRIAEFQAFSAKYMDKRIPVNEVIQICKDAKEIMENEANVLDVNGDVTIVGDTHSDQGAVDFCLREFLKGVPKGKSIVFLGDYVDRGNTAPGGPQGIKNMLFLLKLKTLFPDKVVLLRGNHEQIGMCARNGPYYECVNKYGGFSKRSPLAQAENVFDLLNSVFDYFSLAAVVNGDTMCVHGGVPQGLIYLAQLEEFKKPIYSGLILNENGKEYENAMLRDLLWNDPSEEVEYFGANPTRGEDISVFGRAVKDEFLQKNNLVRLIRAHQCVNDGVEDYFGDNSVLTVFSAPNYEGCENTASILKLKMDGSIKTKQVTYSQHFRGKLNRDKELTLDEILDLSE